MPFLKEHIHGVVGATIFAAATIILLLLLGFTTPLPLPEERGILIDFGGGGSLNAGASSSATSNYQNVSTRTSSNSGVNTQDIEEAPSMQSSDIPNNNNKPNNSSEQTNASENTPNNRLGRFGDIGGALSGETGTGSDGTGRGNGNPGIGSGTNGSGNGPGGIGSSLSGRRQVKKVEPVRRDNSFGKVELEINVDEKGNITYISVVESTCPECTQSAIDAVKQWKYEPKANSGTQTGRVVIIFDQK